MEKKIPLFSPEFQAMVVKDFVGDDHGAETLLTDLEEDVLPAYVEWCRDKPDAHWRTLAERRAISLARVCLASGLLT